MSDILATKIENLQSLMSDLALAQKMLKESFDNAKQIGLKDEYEGYELIEFEALSGRFARVSDLLLQKIFRAIDSVEMSEGGTLLDVLHRAQKRGILGGSEEMMSIRELRNLMVHEYLPQSLQEIFANLLKTTPVLLDLIEKTSEYCKKY